MELKRDDIIKALECWASGDACEGCRCELFEISPDTCDRWIGRNALSLIRELVEENESLKQSLDHEHASFMEIFGQYGEKCDKLTEENERLSGAVKQYEEERKYHFEMSRTRIAEARADTVRKMQEALEHRIHSKLSYHGWYIKETVIAKIAKEMLEEA